MQSSLWKGEQTLYKGKTTCEVKMSPSQFQDKVFRTQTDSNYYKDKSEGLIQALTLGVEEYEINKVTVMGLVDEDDKSPVPGDKH